MNFSTDQILPGLSSSMGGIVTLLKKTGFNRTCLVHMAHIARAIVCGCVKSEAGVS